MKKPSRRNQPGYGSAYNDQGVVKSAAKFRWHRSRGPWEGKTWAKTIGKRAERHKAKQAARAER